MLIRFSVFFLAMAFWLPLAGQEAYVYCSPEFRERPFSIGESLQYRVSYNWGYIWIDAGNLSIQVADTMHYGTAAFHFTGTGSSLKGWDWLFKVRDTVEAISSRQDFSPIWFRRHSDVNGTILNQVYHFDRHNNQVVAELKEGDFPAKTSLIKLEDCTFDILSAAYLARSVDVAALSIGDTITLQIMIDDKVQTMPVLFRGASQLSGRSNSINDTYLFEAIVNRGTKLKAGEAVKIWIGADAHRLPLMVEARLRIGSIKIFLQDV